MTDSAISTTDAQDATFIVARPPADIDAWWTNPEADDVDGRDLIKGDALAEVVGVPFMVHRIVFRDGIQQKGCRYRNDYASLEITTAPHGVMLRDAGRIQTRRNAHDLNPADPVARADEDLVLNDGSTGIYRQILQYLSAKELITLPDGDEEGPKNECIYDLPRSEWLTGADQAEKGFEVRLRCTRGLRFSEYDSEYTADGEDARTYYIA